MWPKKTKYYLGSNKESNWDLAVGLDLSDEAKQNFLYCCYEIAFDMEVSEDGSAEITHMNGIKLEKPVAVTGGRPILTG